MRATEEIRLFLDFVYKDKTLMSIEDDINLLVRLRISHQYFTQLCENKTSLKDLRNLDDDLYGMILDTVEKPEQTMADIESLAHLPLKEDKEIWKEQVDDALHNLMQFVFPRLICKVFYNPSESLSPIETLFIHDKMGFIQQRLFPHQECIKSEWSKVSKLVLNNHYGLCRRCGQRKVTKTVEKGIGFCSNRCHRVDLEDKLSGYKNMELLYKMA